GGMGISEVFDGRVKEIGGGLGKRVGVDGLAFGVDDGVVRGVDREYEGGGEKGDKDGGGFFDGG
ncbi:hypothetical protein, partial [Neisseria sicca]|uniref:hypothetical protein n=1 Tax=Neisseria sicca TaxID=490 RepID=UPI001C99AB1C